MSAQGDSGDSMFVLQCSYK